VTEECLEFRVILASQRVHIRHRRRIRRQATCLVGALKADALRELVAEHFGVAS
jgi:hypothetical protein